MTRISRIRGKGAAGAALGTWGSRQSASKGVGGGASLGGLFVVLGLVLPTLPLARGQEALRMSQASEEAAKSRQEAASTFGYYNLALGPAAWRFSSSLGIEGNDNIRYTGTAPKSDLILRPQVDARMLWPVTDKNSLNLKAGVGYSAYVQYSQYDRLFVTPGSELSFDMYAGDITVNFHDRLSITEDSYQDPTVVGVADYSLLENSLGLAATWDLNKAVMKAGYDHVNYVNTSGSSTTYPDGESEVFSASAGYLFRPKLLAGVETGGSLIHYLDYTISDAAQWNAGAFFEAQVTDYIQLRGSGGYTLYSPQSSTGLGSTGDFSGYYFQIAATHRLNQYVDYTLSGGRSLILAFYGGSYDQYYAEWRANWKIFRKLTFSTTLNYKHGSQLQSTQELFDWFGGGLTLARPLSEKLSTSLAYNGYWRTSNLANRDYTVNTLTLGFTYRF